MAVRGGHKLEAHLKGMVKRLSKAKTVQVGFFEDQKYPDGTLVALVAAIQNYGAPKRGIPPRPFFSNMIAKENKGWPTLTAAALKLTKFDAKKTLEVVGIRVAEQLKQSIIDTDAPALSAVTVMLRGMRSNDPKLVVTGKTVGEAAQRVKDGKSNYGASTKPLVDTGDMLRAPKYKVT